MGAACCDNKNFTKEHNQGASVYQLQDIKDREIQIKYTDEGNEKEPNV